MPLVYTTFRETPFVMDEDERESLRRQGFVREPQPRPALPRPPEVPAATAETAGPNAAASEPVGADGQAQADPAPEDPPQPPKTRAAKAKTAKESS